MLLSIVFNQMLLVLAVISSGSQHALELAINLFNKYVFNDWDFVGFLVVAVFIDTLSGIYASWIARTLYSFRLRQICKKLGEYFFVLIIVHVLTHHLVDGEPNFWASIVFPGFKGFIYFLLIGCEVMSVDENLKKVGKGFLPNWFRSRMVSVQEEGTLNGQNILDAFQPKEEGR
ncbi:hypothetical protein GU926_08165 [Nibribacter ruber]|uniref:Holin n=1 Tax=Nibribacter ruber TaxID=2698458 RepID=A0A6P1NWI2_9BACT|nr:phage holin family protein [Nibribacter ruber]QHL87410.1 hypothetical protein GU926_08165 [Nibribacter ruber]